MEKTLIAHNDAADSGNPMHDDEAARAMGFKGALVPGVTVYGYMTQLLMDCYGNQWLSDGDCHVRFRQPVFANEEIHLTATSRGDVVDVTVENSAGIVTAIATGSINRTAVPAFSPNGVLATKSMPSYRSDNGEKWPPVAAAFRREKVLRSLIAEITPDEHNGFCAEMKDQSTIYTTAIHPAWLLRQANLVVDKNFDLGAWIHTESEIVNLGLAPVGEPLEIRAQVIDLFTRKNNEYVDLDVQIIVAGAPDRPVLRALHRAIYRPALTV